MWWWHWWVIHERLRLRITMWILLWWSKWLRLHRSGIETLVLFKMLSKIWSSLTSMRWDTPMIKLFEELDLFILVHEFREKSHVVSQVVNHV